MKLENQVCSLELAKRLKELGVKQESFFYYDYAPHIHGEPLDNPILDFWRAPPWSELRSNRLDKNDFVSAFIVAELGEMLPGTIKYKKVEYMLEINKNKYKCYRVCYSASESPFQLTEEVNLNEADARAKMLIYLIENKLIEVNKWK